MGLVPPPHAATTTPCTTAALQIPHHPLFHPLPPLPRPRPVPLLPLPSSSCRRFRVHILRGVPWLLLIQFHSQHAVKDPNPLAQLSMMLAALRRLPRSLSLLPYVSARATTERKCNFSSQPDKSILKTLTPFKPDSFADHDDMLQVPSFPPSNCFFPPQFVHDSHY